MLEHPRLALKAEVLAELSRQRTEVGRLAAEAARRVAAGEAAVKQAEELAGTSSHRVEGAKWTCESLKKEGHVASLSRKKQGTRGDEQGKVASIKEGHDVERDTPERCGRGVSYGQLAEEMDELGKACLILIAEFGMRSAVATDTMSTFVKLLRDTEESTSDLAGYGSPAMRFVPVRTAELLLD